MGSAAVNLGDALAVGALRQVALESDRPFERLEKARLGKSFAEQEFLKRHPELQ